MPRPSNRAQRREEIANALMRIMAKKGYEGAALSDVAAEAGLTQGLLHYHFKDKMEILLEAQRMLMTGHMVALAEAVHAAGSPARQVAAFIDYHLGLGATKDPEALACWITLIGEAIRHQPVRDDFEKITRSLAGMLAAIVKQGTSAKVFRCNDPSVAAAALVAAIQGYLVLAATARSVIPRASAAASTKAMADGLLKPKTSILRATK
ncbi:MAG TPA: TetR/AcrR family transcriptional regulator [Acidobacteriota bacterium]|nr:TetR/AcrR family transcriptional regulator [Acidobacteriota bacterium]